MGVAGAPSKPTYISITDLLSELAPNRAKRSRTKSTPHEVVAERLAELANQGAELSNDFRVRREFLDVLKALISGELRGAEELFVDDLHRKYFIRYLYEFVHKYGMEVDEVVISPHYMGIVLGDRNFAIINDFREGLRNFVIGINDFKEGLFINEVEKMPNHRYVVIKKGESNYPFDISITMDHYFMREVFGYDEELPESGVLGLRDGEVGKSFRVSGEITLSITRFNEPTWDIRYEAMRYVSYLIIDKVCGLLLDHGFSPTGVSPTSIRVRGLPDGIDRDQLAKALVQILREYFEVEGADGEHVDIRAMGATVRLRINPRGSSLEISVDDRTLENLENTELFNEIVSDIVGEVRQLLNTERVDEVNVGNHTIQLINALPFNFTYEPRVKPTLLPPASINIRNRLTYIVTPRSKVIIRHAQHGERVVGFDDTYLLRIGTTHVAMDYIERRNRLAFKHLLPQPQNPRGRERRKLEEELVDLVRSGEISDEEYRIIRTKLEKRKKWRKRMKWFLPVIGLLAAIIIGLIINPTVTIFIILIAIYILLRGSGE